MIIQSEINQYVQKLVKFKNNDILEMEKYASKNKVPIIRPEVAALLNTICMIKRPNRILEIGTAIGYSSIIMSKSLDENGRIDTIERNLKMLDIAVQNINKFGLKDKINIIESEAQDVLNMIDSKYDLIFLDGAKGQYHEFFYDIFRLLKVGGVLIADNVLFRGMVSEKGKVIRRKKTLVTNLKSFLNEITNNEKLETSILPFGDGVTISYKIDD